MSLIQDENQRPGTRSWINANGSIDDHRRSTDIEGYCTRTSYLAGETVEICVSSTAPFVVEFYRMGFYGGDGGRSIGKTNVIAGAKRNDPPVGDRQLRECDWPVSVRFAIPSDCVSGVYLGKLTQVNAASPTGSYVIFVVRDNRTCDFLFKCSDTTWSAYNAWPDDFSLYDFHGTPAKIGYWGPGVRVSFDRPYALAQPWYGLDQPERLAWMIGASQFLTFEYPLLFWMESRGFDVSYMSCVDLHDSPAATLRQRARALLAIGHDEYYSIPMHDNLSNAVQATDDIPENGLSVAFLCGGSMTGVTELAPSTDGNRQNRIIRRIGRWGPIDPWLMAVAPEQAGFTDGAFVDGGDLIGARLVEPAVGVGDWKCANTGSPLGSRFYSGTGLGDNDRVRSLIGHEFTGNPVGRPGLEILSEENPVTQDGQFIVNKATATIYPGPKGNLVFNASTMWWPQLLNAATPLPFPGNGVPQFTWANAMITRSQTDMQAVERMTLNLFEMFLA